jgi:type IV pilus assembly protein PilB
MRLGQAGPAPTEDSLPAPGPSQVEDVADEEMIRLFEAILLEAVAARASDVHYEVYGDRPRLRIRVDGDLRDLTHLRFTRAQYSSLVNVGKVRARMDIAEHRAPQGGRFGVRINQRAFDIRAQAQPSLHGEHLVLRLLPQEQKPITIPELGYSADMGNMFQRLLASPAGLLLVVGPTGSGKSTTLYAGLSIVAKDSTRKVITVEDPIEYSLDGVQQCQVLPEVGFNFANAMRSFVREDPDVILVGEIRDPETALEALRASQTGHLVLSTLHCNDAVDAVQRLLDLGMHPNSIGSELLAIISQRLAKRICPACREEDPLPDPELMHEIFPGGVPEGFRAFRGRGCESCSKYGTIGRVAVAEYLPATPTLRIGISRQLPLDELRALARQAGLRPLRERALELVQEGVIALREMRDLLPPGALAGE